MQVHLLITLKNSYISSLFRNISMFENKDVMHEPKEPNLFLYILLINIELTFF